MREGIYPIDDPGVFKVLSERVITYEKPKAGSLVLSAIQVEDSSTLTKLLAYENSVGTTAELTHLETGPLSTKRDISGRP